MTEVQLKHAISRLDAMAVDIRLVLRDIDQLKKRFVGLLEKSEKGGGA